MKNGESFPEANSGGGDSIMIPPGLSHYEVMKLAGAIRPRRSDASFGSLTRVKSTETTAEILDDLRGVRLTTAVRQSAVSAVEGQVGDGAVERR